MTEPDPTRARGVQSTETTVQILLSLADAGEPLVLRDLAKRCDMATAKVHRYLASLVEVGMVRGHEGGIYELGPVAARIGIAAVARIDPINDLAARLPALIRDTRCSAMISVWGSTGPVVVRWERGTEHVITALGVGSVLPVLGSATGRVFAANVPVDWLRARVHDRTTVNTLRETPDAVQEAAGSLIVGLYALAVPVRDLNGQCVAALTLISTTQSILEPHSDARRVLGLV